MQFPVHFLNTKKVKKLMQAYSKQDYFTNVIVTIDTHTCVFPVKFWPRNQIMDTPTRCIMKEEKSWISMEVCAFTIITARKRSFRRLCFHRCLSVHRGRAETPLDKEPPWTETPPPGHRPSHTVTCGRYTSYWNAFLSLIIKFLHVCVSVCSLSD